MEFPARVTLLSGAVVLLKNTSQMDAVPLGSTFQPDGRDGMDGTHLYREVLPSMAGEAQRLKAALKDAEMSLEFAADVIKQTGLYPMKARQAHDAFLRARAALEETVDA